MAKVKLKIVGFPQQADVLEESTVNAENIQEIIQRIEAKYPPDYYSFTIFINGVSLDNQKRTLTDGDEIIIIPIMSGG